MSWENIKKGDIVRFSTISFLSAISRYIDIDINSTMIVLSTRGGGKRKTITVLSNNKIMSLFATDVYIIKKLE